MLLRRALLQPSAQIARRSLLVAAAAGATQTAAATTIRCATISIARNNQSLRSFSTASSSSASPSASASSSPSDDSHSDFRPQSKQVSSTGVEDAKRMIADDIKSNSVFLYMKGTPAAPRCGFSNNVCRILNTYPGVKYGSRDVLEDEYIREGIKQFSDWPTLPQLFIGGEFVGGSDIVSNMYKSGELDKLLGAKPNKPSA